MKTALERSQRLYRFLEELQKPKCPFPLTLDNYPWRLPLNSLPVHPAIDFAGYSGQDSEYLLRVERPRITPPPPPPNSLQGWIKSPIDDPFKEPAYLEKDGAEEFAEDLKRPQDWQTWIVQWRNWAKAEGPARLALKVFEDFYALMGKLDREGDQVELVLGEGILSIQKGDKPIYHPVLLQKVRLEFDAQKPAFYIIEADTPVELYSPAIREAGGEANEEARLRSFMERHAFHPLDSEANEFYIYLVNLLGPQGEFTEKEPPKPNTNTPILGRAPVLFLRPRNQGLLRAIESALRSLPDRIEILTPLQRVVGIDSAPHHTASSEEPTRTWDVQDILLSKPANREQILVLKNLKKHPGVVVQGPPGTGKTHTIANLIGHLLAEGKSVLVTAHTSKALRVLRDKVAPELQPLCVSVVGSDQESRRQLEAAVSSIAQKLGEGAEKLGQEAHNLTEIRQKLIDELNQKRQLLIEALGGEYREVVAAGKGYPPSEAARRVRQYKEEGLDWIPGEVRNVPIPLTPAELEELYQSNAIISPHDENELDSGVPNPENLPEPSLVEKWCQFIQQPLQPGSKRPELWEKEPTLEELERLTKNLERLVASLEATEPWHHAAMNDGQDPQKRVSWSELIRQIQATAALASEAREMSIRHTPTLAPDLPLEEQAQLAREIAEHLKKGGKLHLLTLLLHPRWRDFLRKARVEAGQPRNLEHFRALEVFARIAVERKRLVRRWEMLVTSAGGPSLEPSSPERQAEEFVPVLESKLDWYKNHLAPFRVECAEVGFNLEAYLRSSLTPQSNSKVLNLASALERLGDLFKAKQAQITRRLGKEQIHRALSSLDPKRNRISQALAQALTQRSAPNYVEAYQEAQRLWQLQPHWQRRQKLLERLREAAPDWARAIEKRRKNHGKAQAPKEPEKAWLYRLLTQELDKRAQLSIQNLQAEIAQLEKTLHRVTAELIERKAWSAQIKKTSLQQQQALTGWLNTVKRIGKGTGKRAPRLKAEANRLMAECRSAVPVWIMPLSQVVEQFRPDRDIFDVIIIDEASQTDLSGLVLLTMAKKVIVVGDEKQVSPLAVGEEVDKVEHLQQAYLKDIPNSALFDGRYSLYDIARSSFGGQVMLREHFRCVPEIIQFSNMHFYEGRINPLRESNSSGLKPAVQAERVKGYRNGKTNPVEAHRIVELIKTCIENPLYEGKTFGVISMVGDEQALLIESLLQQELPPTELRNRRLLCGNPAQFQGDERDVIFISLVDTSEGAPLPLRDSEPWRQRFNVAASRAKDQMWVVYSLDPTVDLKPGDLRRLLIEHALNPEEALEQIRVEGAKAESPFEREVLKHLSKAGFRVRAQYPVGSYRIDLVVESNGRKIAIECDGDRYHPPEKWPEDLERQRVLERLGWQFIRIRGSSFYRDPESTMKWLTGEIKKMLEEQELLPGAR